jgi:hypothetical protein
MEVYNAAGERVAIQDLGVLTPGEYQTSFSAENLPSGSYRYVLRTGSDLQNGMMTIIH